jgi:hypothetical protein
MPLPLIAGMVRKLHGVLVAGPAGEHRANANRWQPCADTRSIPPPVCNIVRRPGIQSANSAMQDELAHALLN